MVNDTLPNRILSGTVQVKTNIQEFVENGVVFEGESKVTPVDSVILATGYEVHFPFVDNDILWSENNEVELYKYMFNPHLDHPETLAFIGLIQAVGPAIPISEMQARWHCHLLAAKSQLPSTKKMVKDIKLKRKEIAERYFEGPRHTMQIDWIPFLDELADQFGAKPSLTKLAITDPNLWYHVMFGPSYPYQYRISGPGRWDGARKAIIEGQERIDAAFDTKAKKVSIDYRYIELHHMFNIHFLVYIKLAGISNGSSNGSIKLVKKRKTARESLYDSLISLIYLFLSFVPHLLSGAKFAAITLIALIIVVKLFPAIGSAIPFI